jgi:hypothetical protein
MDKYDGWVIKLQFKGKSYFLPWHFREKRTDVIKAFDGLTGGLWKKYRRKGTHKLIKVKFMEVSDE